MKNILKQLFTKRTEECASEFSPSQDVEQFYTGKGVKIKRVTNGLYPLDLFIGNKKIAGALWVEVGTHEDGIRQVVTYGVYKDRR